jgi:hypothetical protein
LNSDFWLPEQFHSFSAQSNPFEANQGPRPG